MFDRGKISFVVLTAFVFLFSIVCLGISESYSMPNEKIVSGGNVRFTGVEVINNTSLEYNPVKVNSKGTSLTNLGFIFDNNGDVITYRINVLNERMEDAEIGYFNIGTPVCSNEEVCKSVRYSLTYEDGREVKRGDVIKSNSGVSLYLSAYHEGNDIVEPLVIQDLNFVINF